MPSLHETFLRDLTEKEEPKVLVHYVRNSDGTPIGCVVAIDRDHIGWSQVNLSAGDKFDKQFGRWIAKRRAWRNRQNSRSQPHSKNETSHLIYEAIDHMEARAQKYFKGVQC